MDALAKAVLGQLAVALFLSPDAFDPVLTTAVPKRGKSAASILQAIHYKPRSQTGTEFGSSTECEAHVDRGLLTILYPDAKQGLQVTHCHACALEFSCQHVQVFH